MNMTSQCVICDEIAHLVSTGSLMEIIMLIETFVLINVFVSLAFLLAWIMVCILKEALVNMGLLRIQNIGYLQFTVALFLFYMYFQITLPEGQQH